MPRARYSDHMTKAEEAALLADLAHIADCYASQVEPPEPPEDWEDEPKLLAKAGLNCGHP
jgi:hypothetical protein